MKILEICNCIVLLSFLIFASGCQTTGGSNISSSFNDLSPEKVALVEVIGDQRDLAEINKVEDIFIAEMKDKGYTVMSRMTVKDELDKNDFDMSERVNDHEAAKIGEILNTHAVTLLEVNIDDETVNISGRMIEPGNTEVIWSGSSRGGSNRIFSSVSETIMGSAVDVASQSVAVGGHGGRIARDVAGDVASEAREKALSQEETQVLQEAVRNLVEDLPQR